MIYIAIDEGYCITKLKSQKELIDFCERFYDECGNHITKSKIKSLTKHETLRLWDYSEEEIEELNEGVNLFKDWEYIVHRL